jgi:hypothetical protein
MSPESSFAVSKNESKRCLELRSTRKFAISTLDVLAGTGLDDT